MPLPLIIRLAISHVLHCAILANMHIQALRLVVHGAHAVRLEDAVLLREVFLRKGLWKQCQQPDSLFCACAAWWCRAERTTSSWLSPSFLPMSLFVHSSTPLPPSLWIPGMTRGMVVGGLMAKVRLAVEWRRDRKGVVVADCFDGSVW